MATTAVTVLGSTGTIGINTLDVIARHPDRYRVFALAANDNDQLMAEQCRIFQPEYAAMVDENAAQRLHSSLAKENPGGIKVLSGIAGLEQIATDDACDSVMAAIVGAAGLLPTLAAARAGKRILLANKESLVMCGQLFMQTVYDNGATLLPVDSEHNAIWQCLPANQVRDGSSLNDSGVCKILLTASGGPFRSTSLSQLAYVTPEQACAHPNWRMGRKISVDSATMMNKALELIEACWLFGIKAEQIEVVIHPQSIVHSMVAYNDGSVLAQLGNPDMRTPIAYALAWPDRITAGVEPLDIFKVANLSFEQPDYERYSGLRLAREAVQNGGTSTAILNAANEIAVARFLDQKIKFTDIAVVVEKVLANTSSHQADSIEIILEDDRLARENAMQFINTYH
ncbi:MAG: 1-deoxy-D-xylulose-5-phosphate reductoisomerase [Gammaproteobacteria bacterium]|nr:1-deoxy-D-xylulose-5-phosphate reductoisomerase [Gammaproteobacteria bacterium]